MAKKKDFTELIGGIIGKDHSEDVKKLMKGMTAQSEEIRATFICNPEQIRKLKYIALASGKMHKQVVQEALAKYISEWESLHGEIVLPSIE